MPTRVALPPPWPLVLRILVLPLLYAVPFALFFGFLLGGQPSSYARAYKASLVFSAVINVAVMANGRWLARWVGGGVGTVATPGRAVWQAASFALASMTGAAMAGVLVHLFVVPGFLGSTRSVIAMLVFSALFSALFVGIFYAVHFHRAYLERVRSEEQVKARIEHEMRTAAAIQQALLPIGRTLPPLFEVAGAALPSRSISGDFLDYFELPGGRLAFVLGDVAGKGPAAALMAAAIQGMFTSVADSEERPADAMDRVNRALVRRSVQSKFATVFHGLLLADGRLYACNAGHNPPLLVRAGGETQWLATGGLLLGVFEQATFEEQPVHLAPGDTLVLFSDGVTEAEAPGGEMFGEERLLHGVVAARAFPAAGILGHILEEVRTFGAGSPQADDITVLVVRYAGVPVPEPMLAALPESGRPAVELP
jgi:serine phosphatase RsbU (regulator of sigma subunit)